MGFLKVITSIALAVFFLIFLNNLMAMVFPANNGSYAYYGGDDAYSKCSSLQPVMNGEADYNSTLYKTGQEAYQKCVDEKTREVNDKAAVQSQYVWLRAIIILLMMVAISIVLFKRFPFYGGALIAGGLLFAITYPIFARTGFSFDSLTGSGGDVSEGVRRTTQMIKMFSSLVGVAGLTVADLLFFEKHHSDALPAQNVIKSPVTPASAASKIYPLPKDERKVDSDETKTS